MPFAKVPTVLEKLMPQLNSVGRDALKLTILKAVRSNEAPVCDLGEFDLKNAFWSITVTRIVMRLVHIIPLWPRRL